MPKYIYKITNTNNDKIYVGKTTLPLERRFKQHIKEAQRYMDSPETFSYESKIYPAMCKYGIDIFSMHLIEKLTSNEDINEREKYWISFFNCIEDGYNISPGGLGGPLFKGHTHSEDSREKMSIIRKSYKRHWYNNGEQNLQINEGDKIPEGFYRGRIISDETRIKCANSSRKKYQKEDWKTKAHDAAMKGHVTRKTNGTDKMSLEAREKMSQSIKTYFQEHPEIREHLGDNLKGRIAISKDDIVKMVPNEQKGEYLNDGWILGNVLTKGRKVNAEIIKKISTTVRTQNEEKFNAFLNQIKDEFIRLYVDEHCSSDFIKEHFNISGFMKTKIVNALHIGRKKSKTNGEIT